MDTKILRGDTLKMDDKTIKGHQDDYINVKYKEGDAEKFIIKLKNNSKLAFFYFR